MTQKVAKEINKKEVRMGGLKWKRFIAEVGRMETREW
jgi:hypothetical protein